MKKSKYRYMGMNFDVTADFRGISRILDANERYMQFIKDEPVFFLPQDDKIIECKNFYNELKLWLMHSKNNYFVFLNCGIQRYDNYLSDLDGYDGVCYDISYPILEIFDTENEALEFYGRLKLLISQVKVTEPICQKFNGKYISEVDSRDYSDKYSRNVDAFVKTLYEFNNSQKLTIFLQKIDSIFGIYYIFVNRKLKISFNTIEDRNACWDYLTDFYEKFNMKKICDISTQLFLTDFLFELMNNSEYVDKFQKIENRVTALNCKFNGYKIEFRRTSRNGRYHGNDFEFKIYKYENFEQVYCENRYKMEYLKKLLQEVFAEEEFMQKYFKC